MVDNGASHVNAAASTILRVADSANDMQQLNLDFINYITDLTGGVDESSAYATDVTIDPENDTTYTSTTDGSVITADEYAALDATAQAGYEVTEGTNDDDVTVARYQTDEYMQNEYAELYASFGSNLFDSNGTSSLVDSDGVFTAGGSALVNYYTQNLSDSITVMAALTKSIGSIQKNALQTFARDLGQM